MHPYDKSETESDPAVPSPPTSTNRHAQCEAKVDQLDERLDAALRTLHDLKEHVKRRASDVVEHPEEVANLVSRAETLLDGEVPAIVEQKRRAEARVQDLERKLEKLEETNARLADRHEEKICEAARFRSALAGIRDVIDEFGQVVRPHVAQIFELIRDKATAALAGGDRHG